MTAVKGAAQAVISKARKEVDFSHLYRIPRHIGVIPDGNRRWAIKSGMQKHEGYQFGLEPSFRLCDLCIKLGVEEITFYGFTQDNTKRPEVQRKAFQGILVQAAHQLYDKDLALMVIGNTSSSMFPSELLPFTNRTVFGRGLLKTNVLVNYSWQWDLEQFRSRGTDGDGIISRLGSSEVSRIDLILRWGGRMRLSGFLPVQSVYSDMYVIDELWPDYRDEHVLAALEWFQEQDVTLGG
ncbi:MAG: undecaprenyl diphosphate synthase family protein [Methanomassiliicoccus sp.]|nr:undecaprenyl diphosphate synthase family protein [Methanomassiliicoccus sp.]